MSEPEAEDRAVVILNPVAFGPSHTPSRIRQCEVCGQDCWLSILSGDAVIEAAIRSGHPVTIACMPCAMAMVSEEDEPPEVVIVPETLAEARDFIEKGMDGGGN